MTDRKITELSRTCHVGVTPAGSERSGERPADPRAKRLEDVEKFVRNSDQRLSELEVWSLDMIDRLLTRIEALEARMGESEPVWSISLRVE